MSVLASVRRMLDIYLQEKRRKKKEEQEEKKPKLGEKKHAHLSL